MILKKLSAFLILLSIVCSFTSCGTIINGTRQDVSVTTIPTGATVSDGVQSWTTPVVISLARKRDHILTISKDGYETQAVIIKRALSGASAANILIPFGSLIGVGIDAISGGLYRLVPDKVTVQLKPLSPFDIHSSKNAAVKPRVKDELQKILNEGSIDQKSENIAETEAKKEHQNRFDE
jgi:hypothetical protein